MVQRQLRRSSVLGLGVLLALGLGLGMTGRLAAAEQTTVHVFVKDASTGEPIYQAHLTLKFRQPGGFLKRSKIISYTAKTDKQGRCAFPLVSMGEITLMVTAPDHASFGKDYEVSKESQLIEVKLRKPRPQL